MKNSGFSLVELIVVIAIMAILVGVAVPVYSQYIDKAQKAKDEQYMDELAHATQIFAAEKGLELVSVAVAPIVTGSQGIELYVKDDNNATVRYTGSMDELYGIVGEYTFQTVNTQNVTYFTPTTPDPGNETEPHTHDFSVVKQEKTCTSDGILGCSSDGCTATIVDPSTGHTYSGTPVTVGNMHIYTCTNEGCNYQIIKFDGESLG